jgi:hypothetical protein
MSLDSLGACIAPYGYASATSHEEQGIDNSKEAPGPSLRVALKRPRKRSMINLQTYSPTPIPVLFVKKNGSDSNSVAE